VVQEHIAGESPYGLAKRHDLSRQLIRVWIEKYEAGGLDEDAQAADLPHEYETKIVALERLVGRRLGRSLVRSCAGENSRECDQEKTRNNWTSLSSINYERVLL
jgi:transposase-like protein